MLGAACQQVKYPEMPPAVLSAAAKLGGGKAQPALQLVGYEGEVQAAIKYAFGTAFVCQVGKVGFFGICVLRPYVHDFPCRHSCRQLHSRSAHNQLLLVGQLDLTALHAAVHLCGKLSSGSVHSRLLRVGQIDQ